MKKEADYVIPIICALVVACAPHAPGLPLWINAWCLLMWGYMLVRLKTGWPMPGNYIRYGLAFIGIFGLLHILLTVAALMTVFLILEVG